MEPSLRELILVNLDDTRYEEDPFDEEFDEGVLPLGSLIRFRELRSLEATTRTLLGQDSSAQTVSEIALSMAEHALHFVSSLPQKLEVLTLHSSMGSIYTIMAILYQAVRNNEVRALKKVVLIFPRDTKESLESRTRCVEEGKSVGIVVQLEEETA